MLVLAIVHQRDAGPGVFAEVMQSRGVELDWWLPTEDARAPRGLHQYDAVLTLGGSIPPMEFRDAVLSRRGAGRSA